MKTLYLDDAGSTGNLPFFSNPTESESESNQAKQKTASISKAPLPSFSQIVPSNIPLPNNNVNLLT